MFLETSGNNTETLDTSVGQTSSKLQKSGLPKELMSVCMCMCVREVATGNTTWPGTQRTDLPLLPKSWDCRLCFLDF